MIVAGLVEECLGILNQLLANFVGITTPVYVSSPNEDGQLALAKIVIPATTAKGNALTGAIADILTSGAQLVDMLLQVLTGFAPETAALPSATL